MLFTIFVRGIYFMSKILHNRFLWWKGMWITSTVMPSLIIALWDQSHFTRVCGRCVLDSVQC
jgi:hypothetical protein